MTPLLKRNAVTLRRAFKAGGGNHERPPEMLHALTRQESDAGSAIAGVCRAGGHGCGWNKLIVNMVFLVII
jgi:hypothetical protein